MGTVKKMNVLVGEIDEEGEHQNNQNEHLIKSKTKFGNSLD